MICDFIVVGAGIAGASVAYELSRDARVCVLEAEDHPGMHSTGRSAALFAPSYGGKEIRALTRASQPFYVHPPAGFAEHALLRPRGCLYIARADQIASLDYMVDEVVDSGGRVRHVSREDALARAPRLRPGYLAAAAFDPDAYDIEVHALHQGFLRGARERGTRIVTARRLAGARRQGRIWRCELEGETLEAPVLIDAAGAWADEVALACGAEPVGLEPFRRTAMLVDPPAGIDVSDWPAVIDAEEQFYFKPDAGKLLLSPADETPDRPGDAQPEALDVAIGVDRVQAALDLEVRRISHSWAGLRTFAPDRVPVVGYDPAVEGLFWLAGQGGYGIQTAPAMARVAAALARGEPAPADVLAEGLVPASLSPARFAVSRRRVSSPNA
jgi:D-arginine dehydrogenase